MGIVGLNLYPENLDKPTVTRVTPCPPASQVPFPLIPLLNGSALHPCGVESLGILSVPGNGIFWALPAVISSIDHCVSPAHCSLFSVPWATFSSSLFL